MAKVILLLKVDGNTGLIAGVITSTAPEDKNKLETGTLSWSDIETGSQWETKTSGFGGTIGTGASGAAGSGPLFKPTLKDGDKDSGSVKSAISSGQITITNPEGQNQDLAALNRDTTNTNDEIKALPDLQAKLNEQLKTQQEWTQAAANMATARYSKSLLSLQPNCFQRSGCVEPDERFKSKPNVEPI